MFNSKYSDIRTVVIIVIIIAIIGLLGFWAYDVYKKSSTASQDGDAIDEVNSDVSSTDKNNTNNTTDDVGTVEKPSVNSVTTDVSTTTSGGTTKQTYKGFTMVGYIEIPKTGIKYPVLEEATAKSIEVSVAILCGPGLNKTGNTVIEGHNYRNGTFFSDNAKISVGDKIYITDESGNKVTYIVYNTYETTPEDSEYVTRETNGATEITLLTCTDDVSGRIIICAKAE